MRSSPLTIVMVIASFAAVLYATLDVMIGFTGPLAIAAKWIGIAFVLISFARPKVGMVLLALFCFYGDFYKKMAVVYGTVSMETVIEVLAINMAILGAIIAGTINKMFLIGPRPHRAVIVVGLITLLLTGLLMLTNGGLASRVQLAVNGGLYLGLAAVIGYLYSKKGESLRLSRLHFLLGIPWIVVACYQYAFGFSDADYFYAATYLSPVFSNHFFMEHARVFGLAGSASAYGAITLLFTYGIWRIWQSDSHRLFWLMGSVVYFIGLVISTQRTILVQPFLVLIVWRLFRSRAATQLFYLFTVITALLCIGFSNVMLSKLDAIDANLRSLTGDSGWAAQVLRVGTFSDRLQGWTRLTRPESYSLFGTPSEQGEVISFADENYAHDMINVILINYGLLGLIAVMLVLWFMLKRSHATVFKIEDPNDRSTLAFILANLAVSMLLGLFGGGNLHTVPLNLLVATLAGHGVAILVRNGAVTRQPAVQPRPVPGRLRPATRAPLPAWPNQGGA